MDNQRSHDRRARATRGGRWVALIVVAGWFLADATVVRAQGPPRSSERDALSRRVEGVLATPGFQTGHWGILVVDRKTGETIYERNRRSAIRPRIGHETIQHGGGAG